MDTDTASIAAADSGLEAADLAAMMLAMGRRARTAAHELALAPTARKNDALTAMTAALRQRRDAMMAANAEDVAEATVAGAAPALIDRLTLTAAAIEGMVAGIETVRGLADPVGEVMAAWTRPNGLRIERVRVPLGVVGVIYESRPNVTADAGVLALKAGNAVILRGGSESLRTSRVIHAALRDGLLQAGLPDDAIQLVPTRDRAAVGSMLAGLDGAIDVIVPRGGKGLVGRVQREARVPVFAHLEGICHVYVDAAADPAMAERIVFNAKLRRTGVCGAAETLLVDHAGGERLLAPLVTMLLDKGCEVRGDALTQTVDGRVVPATAADWSTEYLDAIIAVKVVDCVGAAIDHIARFGSHHTDTIVTADAATAERFLREVDSAIVLHNASTQFADGGEFGFGAEIGIATGRIHARGPVAIEQLCTFKYRVWGAGQIRA